MIIRFTSIMTTLRSRFKNIY